MVVWYLLPDTVVHVSSVHIIVERHDIHNSLGILFLLIFGYPALLEHSLPFFGEALSRGVSEKEELPSPRRILEKGSAGAGIREDPR